MQPQQLGRLRISKVLEMDAGGPPMSMALPDLKGADLERLATWCSLPDLTSDPNTTPLSLSMHSFVIQVDGQNILVDACNGNDKQRCVPPVNDLKTPYLENLAAAGFRPEDIHLVMCTHLHFDHVGWNTRLENGRWVPTFPNARYIFGKRDYDHWSTQEIEEEFVHRQAYEDSVLPIVQAGRADIIDVDNPVAVHREIGEGVWMEPAFGHSPGCVLIKAQSAGAPSVFWGDVIHHPVQMIRPELSMPFDYDPAAAVRVRQQLLADIADSDTMCFPAHFRGTSAGHVHRDGNAYRYQFVDG